MNQSTPEEVVQHAVSATTLVLDQARVIVDMWTMNKQGAGNLADAEQIIVEGEQQRLEFQNEIARLHGQIQSQADTHREVQATMRSHIHNLTAANQVLTEWQALVKDLVPDIREQIELAKARRIEDANNIIESED